jgi:hypothetical protein
MAVQVNNAVFDLGAQLLAVTERTARATLVASAVADQLADCGCVVYRFFPGEGDGEWLALGAAGEVALEESSFESDNRLISSLISDSPTAIGYRGRDLRREDYAHLNLTRSLNPWPICLFFMKTAS